MFENIPKNWEKVALENLLEYEQPTNYIVASEEYNDNYPTPVLTAGKSFILGYTNETEGIYQNTPVIIFDDFTTESKFVDFEFKVKSSAMKILKAKDNDTLKYLYYLMQILPFNNTQHKRYWISEYSKIKIGIPKDINEVKEIVKVLDAASEIIRLRTACIESAQDLIPALFQEMFGDVVDNKTMSPIYNLGDVADFVRGPFGGSLKKEIFVKEGYWVYEQYHAINNDFSKARYFIDDKKFNEMKRFEVYPGDILISCSGTMGKIAIVPDDYHKGIINQALLKLSVHNDVLNNIFLKYLLLSEYYQNKYFRNQPGAAIQNVRSVSVLKNIKIILPTIQQQKNFVDKVQEIESYIKSQQAELENAKTMFQSLLHHSFTGELTRHKFGGDANG